MVPHSVYNIYTVHHLERRACTRTPAWLPTAVLLICACRVSQLVNVIYNAAYSAAGNQQNRRTGSDEPKIGLKLVSLL